MAGKLSGKVTIYYAVDFLKGPSELPRGHGLVAKGHVKPQSSNEKPQLSLGLRMTETPFNMN